ncbi:MAG: S46 family peptidase [Bacteroidales bacterium]|nr:S46 family peptidase [Bacteroidales bacterium]
MIKQPKLILSILFLIVVRLALADGGMWIPMLIEKYNIETMQKKGCKLSADDIYSINHSSLKDAIVQFGGGCTGELISNDGLLITNHHCGYGSIQKHSSVEHDYLTDGFWAMSKKEELPNDGLTVSFLILMQDVTTKTLENVTDEQSEPERQSLIRKNIEKIRKEVEDSSRYKADVETFYSGNQYFLFIYEIFNDVRLVGAPPSSIGKFGGDTDNWMWPRHTGDFSMFRIYADKDNKPASYSTDNVPYHPKKSLSININGINENDFTMVFGYPGHTQEYLHSDAVKYIVEQRNPVRIKLRDTKLAIMRDHMLESDKVRIQLSSKYAHVANGWKKWIGESKGLERIDAIQIKKNFEAQYANWINQESERSTKYGSVLDHYRHLYEDNSSSMLAREFIYESIFAVDVIGLASKFNSLLPKKEGEKIDDISAFYQSTQSFYKDYDIETDKEVMAALFEIYYQTMPEEYRPEFFKKIETKYHSDFNKFTSDVFKKSIFRSEEECKKFLDKFSVKKLNEDPIFQLYQSTIDFYVLKINPILSLSNNEMETLDRLYMKSQIEMAGDSVLFPDANFTLRVAFGKVEGYEPADGVEYKYKTTLSGIMEKELLGMYDYVVDNKLKELYKAKDYGRYGKDDEMPVCFIASNHTTGGNSGSPVLNANGELIGVNFDRNWEGTMSDIMYDPDRCRNIVLDIRYALFIIDKFAGAGYLLDEMNIIN